MGNYSQAICAILIAMSTEKGMSASIRHGNLFSVVWFPHCTIAGPVGATDASDESIPKLIPYV